MIDRLLEKNLLPDPVIRLGIRRLLARRLRQEDPGSEPARLARLEAFMETCRAGPIAVVPHAPNEQHYEVPAEFFREVLGPRMKYSGALWPEGVTTLAGAEEAMLALTCERARIAAGQRILELGCGWGSLTLWLAERYPAARIVGVSNSRSQRAHIEAEAARRGLRNVEVLTADMNAFEAPGTFDRVVSVEMFEHMRNHEALLARIARWLEPSGLLFVHVFAHERFAYFFEDEGPGDWMARHFFTGGMMPSRDLLPRYRRDLECLEEWTVSGLHYARTAEAWIRRMDERKAAILPILSRIYGAPEAVKWWSYWRVFFLACAELWGYRGGTEWIVAHYLFGPAGRPPAAKS